MLKTDFYSGFPRSINKKLAYNRRNSFAQKNRPRQRFHHLSSPIRIIALNSPKPFGFKTHMDSFLFAFYHSHHLFSPKKTNPNPTTLPPPAFFDALAFQETTLLQMPWAPQTMQSESFLQLPRSHRIRQVLPSVFRSHRRVKGFDLFSVCF